MMNFRNTQFLLAAHEAAQWPVDEGAEIAFAGRSNVGKSSAINAITSRQGLARTSKTPGRTQQIVFFDVEPRRRMVDLPGYGYAKVPKAIRVHWGKTISDFLANRECLRGLMVPMDIRRPFTELDCQLVDWCMEIELPVHVLLTKADKLSRGAAHNTLRTVIKTAPTSLVSVQLFSATKKTGVDDARGVMHKWLTGV